MVDVLKLFYTYHYNFGAICVLLLMLIIFFLTKKNFKGAVIVLVLIAAMNVSIYKRTEGKSWTITIQPPKEAATDSYGYNNTPEPIVMTFSVHKNWTITDNQGQVHHWCWVDDYWDKFANTDIIASIWGTNASRTMMQSTERRTSVEP